MLGLFINFPKIHPFYQAEASLRGVCYRCGTETKATNIGKIGLLSNIWTVGRLSFAIFVLVLARASYGLVFEFKFGHIG